MREWGWTAVHLESDAFAASCHLVRWAVFQAELKEVVSWKRMGGMNGGTDLPKRRGLSLRDGKCTLAMLVSDKAEVNQPFSAPLFLEVDQEDI